MREEWVKKSSTVDGVVVFDLGDEFVFSLKNKKDENIEFHLTKPLKDAMILAKHIKEKREELKKEA